MKNIIFAFMLTLCLLAKAADNDTIPANINKVEKFFIDNTKNTKGKLTIKYYVIYDGDIVPTNKSTFEYVALCHKHNVTPKLSVIRSKGKVKRIIK